jgi:hypothetical protein
MREDNTDASCQRHARLSIRQQAGEAYGKTPRVPDAIAAPSVQYLAASMIVFLADSISPDAYFHGTDAPKSPGHQVDPAEESLLQGHVVLPSLVAASAVHRECAAFASD